MTRLGAGILLLVLLAAVAFGTTLSFGPSQQMVTRASHPAEPAPAGVGIPAGRLVVPIRGVRPEQITDSWHDARSGGRVHLGTDIMAPGGTPVLAAADGTIEKLYFSHGGGGITLYERSVDGSTNYYYAHLSAYAAGVAEGQRVRAGTLIAFVGDTGNAGAGNTHLHFGVYRMAPGERWWQGTAINPYPLLARGAVAR